ncbi:heterogeneous nuclear ribonucleoprotein H1, isoform CRA_d [Rattus norvegicus]|uniref:Heterogeneous nuclear ribonucleoprotein H1, isoform CRA_d n=1 Tax=Rattus norvegicus TaxID=10116 RepID=A6HE20_RAT|nr:heterogeneous nuclear ribonucleoprotein H1, isoform CRA_d [Rattus norvegicus]
MHVEKTCFFCKTIGAASTIKSETFGMFVNSKFI